ncbi:unnamed protein product [Owenia fusiformis]|uniref:G-protein coupled receptors family 1 profile domain-containing protein n=1 Tax=Owenia fusiformis TaxID=6347 RepID=A0A8S4PJX1_OWEFU|nr:unnamed protein product [Owenia fusiformis]
MALYKNKGQMEAEMAEIDMKDTGDPLDHAGYRKMSEDRSLGIPIFNIDMIVYEISLGEIMAEDVWFYFISQLKPKVPIWEMVVKVTVTTLVMLVSLIGNSVVVFVVWKNARMRTTTNYYIVNLAISDILVTLCCTWVHLVDDLSEGWVLGAFFCKINTFAQVLTLVSSILTLTLIACDRFFGIVFAMKAHTTERRASVFICLVWLLSIGVASPLLIYRQQKERQWKNHLEIWCDDIWPVGLTFRPRTIYYTFVAVVLYFFPVIVMTIAYSVIIWRLSSSRVPGDSIHTDQRSQEYKKRRVNNMLVSILLVFVFCWLPLEISILYAEHRTNLTDSLPTWYKGWFQYVAVFLAYSNSALNPFIYSGFNENFRKGFKEVFGFHRTLRRRYSSLYSGGNHAVRAETETKRTDSTSFSCAFEQSNCSCSTRASTHAALK